MAFFKTSRQLVLLGFTGLVCSQAGELFVAALPNEGGERGSSAAVVAAAPEDLNVQLGAPRSLAEPADRPAQPQPMEVPDWTHGVREGPPAGGGPPAEGEREEKPRAITVDFNLPFPPAGSWAVGSFSGYGNERPMGALLLSCSFESPNRASCEVVPEDAWRQAPGTAMYRAWTIWGDEESGKAFVSVLPGAPLGPEGVSTRGPHSLVCCERSGNAPGCVACTGFPSPMYDPLQGDDPAGAPKEAPPTKTGPPKRDHPIAMDFEPARIRDIFSILPNLREQLGGNPDPENLPCVPSRPPRRGLPTLGDVLRSRKDLSLFAAMMETSHFQQLVPCPLTLVAVPDARVRDFQGRKAPPCIAAAFARPENQKNLIRFVGRQAALGKRRDLHTGDLPLLFGSPAKITRRGSTLRWSNVDVLGEKIEFDRGVIHLLAQNDPRDNESKELLRRIVYWCCLHEHLLKNPNLTRFALRMVDNKRSLPILGVPPGRRPDWVARENSGWFPPPSPRSAALEALKPEEPEKEKEEPKERKETGERQGETERRQDAGEELRKGLERAEQEARDRLAEAERRFKETQDKLRDAGEGIDEEMRKGLEQAEQEARDRMQHAEEEAKRLRERLEEALKEAGERLGLGREETEKETEKETVNATD